MMTKSEVWWNPYLGVAIASASAESDSRLY